MTAEHYFMIGIGIIMITAGILNWNWWYESRKIKLYCKIITRNGMRIVTIGVGIISIICGFIKI